MNFCGMLFSCATTILLIFKDQQKDPFYLILSNIKKKIFPM